MVSELEPARNRNAQTREMHTEQPALPSTHLAYLAHGHAIADARTGAAGKGR